MPVAGPVRVVLVDDDPLVRAGLRMLLGNRADIAVVAEAADGAAAVELVRGHAPDVVLMDIRMPGLDGVTATEALQAAGSTAKVVVLTTFAADEQILRALRAGAAGFLLKDTAPADIVDAILRVAAGEIQLSPSVTRLLVRQVNRAEAPQISEARSRLAVLTARELDVARAVGAGRTNAEISGQLYLSVPTVKAHVSAILDKLQVSNRVQIAIIVHDANETGL